MEGKNKNGYYLSVYMHIDKWSHILEIRRRHDQSMALWKKTNEKIELIHYWEFERETGIKQHPISFFNKEYAINFINQLLSTYDLTINDMLEIWGTPELTDCITYTSVDVYPDIAYHSIAHLFSAILLDTDTFYKSKILGVALDGGPDNVVDTKALEKNYYAGCYVNEGKVNVFSINSPGRLWTCAKMNFKMREGSLMALASACKARCKPIIDETLELYNVDSLNEANRCVNKVIYYIDSLDLLDENSLEIPYDEKFTYEENRISIIMKEIQRISIKMVDTELDKIILKYKIKTMDTYLALSGGYALNCPTNSYLISSRNFKGMIAPPCVSDTGLALGIGLYAFYKNSNGRMDFKFKNAFYGDRDFELDKIINGNEFKEFVKNVSDFDINQVIIDLIKEPIVWFNERAEIGPRSLGNRSILADPRNIKSKEILNLIKQREWWRPVAPIIMAEKVQEWFIESYASPYMLNTFYIKQIKKELVPSILHLDNSARVQTIILEDNELLYSIIEEFNKITGVPILCNTSLNDKGEPIINKIPEAVNFALRKDMKVMYINGKRIELYKHNEYQNKEPKLREVSKTFPCYDQEYELFKNKINEYNITKPEYMCYCSNYSQLGHLDLNNEKDVNTLKLYYKMFKKNIDWYTFD
jgi:carbamoyltransferase